MMTEWLLNGAIVVATIVAMEGAAVAVHKYIMHGPGWAWHRSHHEPRRGAFEINDLYALLFALPSVVLINRGFVGAWPLQWIGFGMVGYGILYFIAHDGLVHKRWPFRYVPRRGYLKRLYQAHRLHHAVHERDGCVSFGFLYARPVSELRGELEAKRATREQAPPHRAAM